jgi:16S rRNA (cytosine1402-N4)-methyltransferase
MAQEVVNYLITSPDGIYVDGTVGTGGHSILIASRLGGKGRLICLDRDPDAVIISKERLAFLGPRVRVIRKNFIELDKVLEDLGIARVNGVLLDLGMSSHQLETSGRGFSFNRNEPLDMRMDFTHELTAGDLVNDLSLAGLVELLRGFGEERRAKSIAKAIVRERKKRPIKTSSELAGLIQSTVGRPAGKPARHPATRTFQALRIAVNKELQDIETVLNKLPYLMASGGRLVILTYHSLEDRIVKRAMMDWEKGCTCPPDLPACSCGKVPLFVRLSKKGVTPGPQEIEENPRSRSARLRAAERI